MGTIVRMVLYTHTDQQANELAARAFARIAEIESRLSDYRPDSEVMTLCRSAGGAPVAVSDDLFTVLSAAQDVAIRTDGAFDVTVGPLTRLWRRAHVTGELPNSTDIAAAKTLVGYRNVELLGPRMVRLTRPGMLLDLGGIGKGYAASEALESLRAQGTRRALVAIGGDIAAGDAPPGKHGWTIGIAPLGPTVATRIPPLTIQNAAVSTSGDAEQYLERNGTRYSHILTPRTGDAVQGRRGVTVRAGNGMTADALATAVSVLSVEAGVALIDATPGAAAVIIENTPQGVREYRSARW
jgi:thiamine biosynthesis lipoprotein